MRRNINSAKKITPHNQIQTWSVLKEGGWRCIKWRQFSNRRACASRACASIEERPGTAERNLRKDLISKDDKNSLPITKYTEQRHDALKMLVGWEGRGIKRFLEIKRHIKKFKDQHEATFQEIKGQSLANMAAEMRGDYERKNQRLTQYAKSENKEVYDEEDLSQFAGNGNMQVWGIWILSK